MGDLVSLYGVTGRIRIAVLFSSSSLILPSMLSAKWHGSCETSMQCEHAPRLNAARLRRLWISLIVVAVPVAVALWYRQVTEPDREEENIHVLIMSLTERRPGNLTTKQWQSAVAWTNNLHCNSLVWGFKDGPAIRNLRLRLETKLESPVTMDTILWVCDQYAVL